MNNKYKYFNSDKLCCYIRIGSTMMFKYSLQSGANRIKVYGDKSKECLTNYRSFDNEHLILENKWRVEFKNNETERIILYKQMDFRLEFNNTILVGDIEIPEVSKVKLDVPEIWKYEIRPAFDNDDFLISAELQCLNFGDNYIRKEDNTLLKEEKNWTFEEYNKDYEERNILYKSKYHKINE